MISPLTKNQIRQDCLTQRKALNPQFIAQASKKIADSIQNLPIYQAAQHLAWYFPIGGEVDLSTIWEKALKKNKFCYFPLIQTNRRLQFVSYTKNTVLKPNRYHILEPVTDSQSIHIPPQLDIIFLPIVAFDPNCTRLGMGQGYYDKTLIDFPNALLIGVAYEWQKRDYLPRDSWDINPHMIITEEKIYS